MGDNNAVVVQILAVVLILFFCFVTYMNTKTWRATHVTFAFLVFGTAIAFSVYASLTLKTRRSWQKVVKELETKLDAETAKHDVILYGDMQVPKQNWGLIDYREAVLRELVDRGRVWRNCNFVDAQAKDADPVTGAAVGVIKLSTIPPGTLEGAKVEPNHLTEGTVLYAFKDGSGMNPAHTHYVYIGEFTVTAETGDSVTITSTSPLPKLEQGFVGGNQPWILYDRMPTDSQQVFTSNGFTPATVLRPDDFASPEQYQATLREYNRDGMTLEQVIADRTAANEPPLTPEETQNRMFARVKFLKEHKIVVDAADPRVVASGEDVGTFDLSGQALDPRLRRGADQTFKVGEEAEIILHGFSENGMVVEPGADELAKDGVVEVLQTVYHRPLHDYAYEFRHMAARKNQILASLRNVLYETEVVKREQKAAEGNFKARSVEKGKLTEDQTKLAEEIKQITAYADKLEVSYRATRAELSRLYRENAVLHERILAANDRLTREIEARDTSPTALER